MTVKLKSLKKNIAKIKIPMTIYSHFLFDRNVSIFYVGNSDTARSLVRNTWPLASMPAPSTSSLQILLREFFSYWSFQELDVVVFLRL
jgi:hypothetical protein